VAVEPRLAKAVEMVRSRCAAAPMVGVVLGSGLGGFADSLTGATRFGYAEIPGLLPAKVPGHLGALTVGSVGGTTAACLSGRVHSYEGHAPADVVIGCRLLAALGCTSVLLTNAAGGIGEALTPGSLMLIDDHLNLTGQNPLTGTPEPFVDMTNAYDAELAGAARRAARELGVTLHEGVYAGLLGPSYETPAEIRMLRTLGAHAVGMSTVLEVIALRGLGVRVGAVSCITNFAAGLSPAKLEHRDVASVARSASSSFDALLARWIELARAP
jgi:purine-nucleoside phosphorylase